MVLRLKKRGLLVGGPPCNSWVWINSATHGRKKSRIFGNHRLQYVADATAITARFVLLGLIAIARDAFFLAEQPSSSVMPSFPYMVHMATVLAPLFWGKVRFPMGAFGHPNTKPTVLFGTLPYIMDFKRKLSARDKRRIDNNKKNKKFETVRKTISKTSGKKQVTGSHGLKRSAAYPRRFAKFLADKHLEFADTWRPVLEGANAMSRASHLNV
ncbi:unnamed protein product [Durusdinium trenchii]|uniref:Uncharacterized protein n=1 Tax=Durusdinium trenchii TaxID=1381693 RepID=A0ABP0HXU1_9DINO